MAKEAYLRMVLVSGSSGMVGSEVVSSLHSAGHHVMKLVRTSRLQPGEMEWDPQRPLEPGALSGCHAVVHLAGESIASGRWTEAKKTRIRESRVQSTRSLVESMATTPNGPKTLICASAVGYYGDRGGEILGENSASGAGFLAQVCREWEAAANKAASAGIRVVTLRFGVILSPTGGVLKKMLPLFRLGLGGKLGSGKQYMSWIALADVAAVIQYALGNVSVSGPVNVVAPHPVTNAEFTTTLGKVLSRPTAFSVPAGIIRKVFGQMGEELFLSSQHVEPSRLQASKFSYEYPQLETALRAMLSKGK